MRLAFLLMVAIAVRAEEGCILVDRSSVKAGDLVEVIPGFRAIAADRHLLWAPAPGLTRWLNTAHLSRMASKEGVAISLNERVCLQRRTIVYTEKEVLHALRERLPEGAEIQVLDYLHLPTISGKLRFDIHPAVVPASEHQPIHWRGTVIAEDGRTAPFWVRASIQVPRRVVRATRQIPANTILTRDDVVEVSKKEYGVISGEMVSASDLVGKETSRRIEAQQPIKQSWLREPALIRKGQAVRVIVESGQAVLGLDAHALNGGNRGDTLVMRNDDSGKSFRAQITGPGTAIVRMEVQSK